MESHPGPFCGRCDSVKITVLSDGHVWIEHGYWRGDYRDWTVNRRRERVSVESFALFRERLRAHRPNGELVLRGKPPCETFWHDVDEVWVEWRDRRRADKLIFNFGCDPETRRGIAEALRAAPDALGIPTLKLPQGQWLAISPS
jgi:hypothetical protein